MKTIIAATDFSPISLNAVNYAADLAKALNSSLAVLHVCQIPMNFSEIPYPVENLKEMENDAKEKIQGLKKELEQRTEGKIKIYGEVRIGTVYTEIENYADALKPYALVMGTQGGGAFERMFFGSNTIIAMKRLSWPLIVVPPEAKFTSIKKVGLACDLKKVVETSPVREVSYLVKELGAELFVLHINSKNEPAYTAVTIEESGLLQEMLQGLNPSYHFLNDEDIEEGLARFAEQHKLDMLIVVPKKHSFIEQLFHKSRSRKLVLHTHVPVMSVHEH